MQPTPMTSPSDLPPLKQDDEIGAKAHWTRQLLTQASIRLLKNMECIYDLTQEFLAAELEPDLARDRTSCAMVSTHHHNPNLASSSMASPSSPTQPNPTTSPSDASQNHQARRLR